MSTTSTRSKRLREKNEGTEQDSEASPKRSKLSEVEKRALSNQQLAQEYVDFASKLVLSEEAPISSYGYNAAARQLPTECISVLGYLRNPVRRPSVIEMWSPYEIVLFEGAMNHYGKHFDQIQKQIRSKSTKQIIEFYYIWKKTSHYKEWKRTFVEDDASEDGDSRGKK